jgi:hypothetical protein
MGLSCKLSLKPIHCFPWFFLAKCPLFSIKDVLPWLGKHLGEATGPGFRAFLEVISWRHGENGINITFFRDIIGIHRLWFHEPRLWYNGYNADLTFKLDFNTEIMGEHHDQPLFTCKNEDAHDE